MIIASVRVLLSPGRRLSFLALGLAAAAASVARADLLLESAGARLHLDAGHLRVERAGAPVAEVTAFEFNFTAPQSLAVLTHDADRVTLRAVYPSVAKYRDETGDLPVTLEISRVAGGFRFHARPEWAFNTTVRLRDLDDHYFGVLEPLNPDNRPSPDLRGQVVDVEALGDQNQYHENYASAWSAFYMTARGAASFFDTFARGRYQLGVNGETVLTHRTGALDWYLFVGADGDELLAAYYQVIGAPKAPPLWALGPIGWRDGNNGGAAEILDDVRRMTDLRIPFTAWFVDRPYSDGAHAWSKMNFSPAFADPARWIGELQTRYDLKFMTWIAPMTFGDPDFPSLLPGDRGYMDLSAPDALAEFERRLSTQQYAVGVRGHKMDRAEEYLPEMARWHDGTRDPEARNKYLYLYARATHDMLARAWGADHVNFARGAIHRTQPYLTAIWGGDSRSSWAGLAGNLANAIRSGFMGFPVWGTDVGGYLGGRIDEELYARWLQWGAWNGLFEIKLDGLNGQGADRPPWVYGPKLQDAFRAAAALRMRLLPYLYSLARTSARHGVLMKPLAYVWPADPATHDVWDEYLLGSAFLVAPLTAPGGRRSVYLPAGEWYEFAQPAAPALAGGRTIEVSVPFERIPVFVRANSLYVTGAVPLGNARLWAPAATPTLDIHATPGRPGESVRFEFVDLHDHDHAKLIELTRSADGLRLTAPALGAGGDLVIRTGAAVTGTLSGRAAAGAYDAASGTVRVPFRAGEPIDLRLAFSEVSKTAPESPVRPADLVAAVYDRRSERAAAPVGGHRPPLQDWWNVASGRAVSYPAWSAVAHP